MTAASIHANKYAGTLGLCSIRCHVPYEAGLENKIVIGKSSYLSSPKSKVLFPAAKMWSIDSTLKY